jgi:uncharacterized membrane protein YpjA
VLLVLTHSVELALEHLAFSDKEKISLNPLRVFSLWLFKSGCVYDLLDDRIAIEVILEERLLVTLAVRRLPA